MYGLPYVNSIANEKIKNKNDNIKRTKFEKFPVQSVLISHPHRRKTFNKSLGLAIRFGR